MHDPPLAGYRAAATAAIFNERGQLLFTRRAAHINWPGQWCLPGGHLEVGERWDQAVRREVREEIGVEIEVLRLIGIYSEPRLFYYPDRHAEGTVQLLIALFACRIVTGEPSLSEEVTALAWAGADDLPEPLMESHRIRVADALARRAEAVFR